MPNEGGRVVDDVGSAEPGVYCAGWIKRGPTGIIGTNKKDATQTVDLLLEDLESGALPTGNARLDLETLLAERGVDAVSYSGWEAIDAFERGRGATRAARA